MASFFDNAVERVVIETSWLPPIELTRPLATGGGGAPAQPGAGGSSGSVKVPPLSRMLQPRVTIYSAYTNPITLAPYGAPANNWPYVKLLLGLGGALFALVAIRHWRELRECRRAHKRK